MLSEAKGKDNMQLVSTNNGESVLNGMTVMPSTWKSSITIEVQK
jgi:hypothetical protein